MQFDPNSTPPCYKTQDEDVVIQQDDEIRIKIVGLRVDATDIVSDIHRQKVSCILNIYTFFLVCYWNTYGRLLGFGQLNYLDSMFVLSLCYSNFRRLTYGVEIKREKECNIGQLCSAKKIWVLLFVAIILSDVEIVGHAALKRKKISVKIIILNYSITTV
jgi:hypothetical protein